MRAISEGMDTIVGKEHKVLDHGFIRVVDYMGNDGSIVQAARVSYGQGTKTVREDSVLIKYLMRNEHSTPFEMCEVKLHVKLPIFVARQWVRHRTANINEYSARYSIACEEFYVPSIENINVQSSTNRQGRGNAVETQEAKKIQESIKEISSDCYKRYQEFGEAQLARELSRMVLPVNFYTQWYWKIDLNNFMRFIKLRLDVHAQYEIREYAKVMLEIMKLWVPFAYESFMDYHMDGIKLSSADVHALRKMIKGEHDDMRVSQKRAEEIKGIFFDLEHI